MTTPEIRKPGRPAKLRECTSCHTQKPARAFSNSTTSVCRECRPTATTLPAVTPNGASLVVSQAVAARVRWQIPDGPRAHELALDTFGFFRTADALAAVVGSFQRCRCCYTAEHVRTVEIEGRPWPLCAVCSVQICACGRCETHKSGQLIPSLAGNVVPHVPIEIHRLFESQTPVIDRPALDSEPDNDP